MPVGFHLLKRSGLKDINASGLINGPFNILRRSVISFNPDGQVCQLQYLCIADGRLILGFIGIFKTADPGVSITQKASSFFLNVFK